MLVTLIVPKWIRFRTEPVRYDWTRLGTYIAVSNTSPAEVRYDWIPAGSVQVKKGSVKPRVFMRPTPYHSKHEVFDLVGFVYSPMLSLSLLPRMFTYSSHGINHQPRVAVLVAVNDIKSPLPRMQSACKARLPEAGALDGNGRGMETVPKVELGNPSAEVCSTALYKWFTIYFTISL